MSVDSFLGLPYNIASYALLTHMLAQQCGLEVGEVIGNLGDVHIYNNHREQVELQLSRGHIGWPELVLTELPNSIDDYSLDSFALEGYAPHPAIKAPIAV